MGLFWICCGFAMGLLWVCRVCKVLRLGRSKLDCTQMLYTMYCIIRCIGDPKNTRVGMYIYIYVHAYMHALSTLESHSPSRASESSLNTSCASCFPQLGAETRPKPKGRGDLNWTSWCTSTPRTAFIPHSVSCCTCKSHY